ncbi:MAG TPA: rod-binding protein [Alphaproteobacteria bacterium]|nr:rod-binding protein [Alphaproteobacteria bacterium]
MTSKFWKVSKLFGGGKGEEVFKSLLLQEYGKLTAKTGKIGIADAVQNELIKLQEQSS